MFLIRLEKPADAASIRGLVAEAFLDHPHSNQTEHLLVDALREAGALMLSLVAIQNEEVIGYIAFSPVTIDGVEHGWIGLGPVAVRPDRQRRGVGEALIAEGLEAAQGMGARGCVVLGDPGYYGKYGFEADGRLVLDGVPPEYFMALPFGDGMTPKRKVTYHPAFTLCG